MLRQGLTRLLPLALAGAPVFNRLWSREHRPTNDATANSEVVFYRAQARLRQSLTRLLPIALAGAPVFNRLWSREHRPTNDATANSEVVFYRAIKAGWKPALHS